MNPITVTGRLGDDPRTFTTRDGSDGVELCLAIDLPSLVPGGDGVTCWVKVTAFGLLATRAAQSVRKGDRIIVLADDLLAEAWTAKQWQGNKRDLRGADRRGVPERTLRDPRVAATVMIAAGIVIISA